METKRIIVLAFAMLFGIGATAQENFNKAQKTPQSKEVVLVKESQTRNGHDNLQSAYKAALHEAKKPILRKKLASVTLREVT